MGLLIVLGLAVVFGLVCWWAILERAGQPGWLVLVPIVNFVAIFRVAGMSGFWVLPAFLPLLALIDMQASANMLGLTGIWALGAIGGSVFEVAYIVAFIEIAKRFGKSAGYGIGLYFLFPFFAPPLAFGSATYAGPQVSGGQPSLREAMPPGEAIAVSAPPPPPPPTAIPKSPPSPLDWESGPFSLSSEPSPNEPLL